MIYPRKLLKKILPLIGKLEAVVVTGIRRCGKTFLLKDIYSRVDPKNALFLDLENPLNRRLFEEENYETIKTNLEKLGLDFKKRAFVFLDEIQLMPNLPSVVKYFIDHYKTKFFLTGSASFYLKNLFAESLAGRKFVFELFPLSFEEFLLFKNSLLRPPSLSQRVTAAVWKLFEPFWKEYLEFGAFPEVVLSTNASEKKMRLQDIFTSYFQKEVVTFSDFKKTETLRNFILLLAENVGSILNLERFASELKVSRLTLEEWLSFLEATYLVTLAPPFSRGQRVAIRKAKKVYFVDWALAKSINQQSLGQTLENCAFHLLRLTGSVSFYQKKSGAEIDFILNKKIGFEVKVSGRMADQKNLQRLSKELGLKKCHLITENYSPVSRPVFSLER